MAGRVILANAFSLNMLPLAEGQAAEICVKRIDLDDARRLVDAAAYTGRLECAIGHASTAKLAEELLDTIALGCERKMIQLQPGDTLIALTLSFRPPEGKVYSCEELVELLEQGKLGFYAVHYGPC